MLGLRGLLHSIAVGQLQRVEGPCWGAPHIRVVLKVQAGGVQEPLPIGQLIRPHDVEEGRAQRLQLLTGIGDLTTGKNRTVLTVFTFIVSHPNVAYI